MHECGAAVRQLFLRHWQTGPWQGAMQAGVRGMAPPAAHVPPPQTSPMPDVGPLVPPLLPGPPHPLPVTRLMLLHALPLRLSPAAQS